MANEHLLRTPHIKRDEEMWWYEEAQGINIYNKDMAGQNSFVGTIHWRSLRAALARKDRPSEKKPRKRAVKKPKAKKGRKQ